MNVKVISAAAALAVCAVLAGCDKDRLETVSEMSTYVPAATYSAASESEEESETTPLTTSLTTAETEETVQSNSVPRIEVSDLKAIRGEKMYFTPECRIIEDIMYEN